MGTRASAIPYCHHCCLAVGLLALSALAACAGEATRSATELPVAASTELPRVVERPLAIAEGDQPDIEFDALHVSDRGLIAYRVSDRHAPLMRIIDTTGARVAAFGVRGEGPGEFGSVSSLGTWAGDTLYIDTDHAVFSAFTADGKHVRTWRTPIAELALGILPDGSVVQANPIHTPGEVLRVLPEKRLLSQQKPFLEASESLVARGLLKADLRMRIPFGHGAGRLAIGDGSAYQIDVYDTAGRYLHQVHRDLPPQVRGPRRLASLEQSLATSRAWRGPNGEPLPSEVLRQRRADLGKQAVPHFGRSPFFFDGKGRLWVFGPTGDSTYADVFADTTFLGRLIFPCYNGAERRALAGSWLVMSCAPDEDRYPVNLRLYRIEG